MQKPITVARQEFIDDLSDVINQSGLPAFLIVDVMKEFILQLEPLEKQQFARDSVAWGKYISENKQEEKGE